MSADTAGLELPDCHVPAFLTQPGKDCEGGSMTARTVFEEGAELTGKLLGG